MPTPPTHTRKGKENNSEALSIILKKMNMERAPRPLNIKSTNILKETNNAKQGADCRAYPMKISKSRLIHEKP
jgi:hypothetical protein